MKLIHCADIHLDSKLDTNLSPARAQLRNHELCSTFERMVQFAQEHSVKVILICGDLFDTERVTDTTVAFVLDVMVHFPRIHFFYLQGNHDARVLEKHPLPNNLHLFSDEWRSYRSGSIVISGIELTPENTGAYASLALNENDKNIVMLHGQISGGEGAEAISLSKFRKKNIDYLALGHLHSYQAGELDHRGIYAYSGCLEGRGFDETGEKGFILLDVDDNRLSHTFVPFASRTIHKVTVDVSDAEKITDILRLLRNESASIPENDMVEFILTGEREDITGPDTGFLENMLSPHFFYCKVTDETRLALSRNSAWDGSSLKRFFLESVQEDDTLNEAEQNAVIQLGLAALNGKETDR